MIEEINVEVDLDAKSGSTKVTAPDPEVYGINFRDKLDELDFSSHLNMITFKLPLMKLCGKFPNDISLITNLRVLDVSCNNLEGLLPEGIKYLVNLEYLDLYRNNFEGALDQFVDLKNLSVLSVSCNKFTGSIPESISRLNALTQLSASYNELKGPVPSTIGDLINLKILRLSFNLLEGELPASMGNLIRLQELSLAGNKLSGYLPDSMVNLKKISNLFLSFNCFVGIGQNMYLENRQARRFIKCYCSKTIVSDFVPRPLSKKFNLGSIIMLGSTFVSYVNFIGDIWAIIVFSERGATGIMALAITILIIGTLIQLLRPTTASDHRMLVLLQVDLFVECWRCIQNGALSKAFFQLKMIDLLAKDMPNVTIHIFSVITLYSDLTIYQTYILSFNIISCIWAISWLLGSCSLRAMDMRGFLLEVLYNLLSCIFRVITLALVFAAKPSMGAGLVSFEFLLRLYIMYKDPQYQSEVMRYSVARDITIKTILFMGTDSMARHRVVKFRGFVVTSVFGWMYVILFFAIYNVQTEAVKNDEVVSTVLIIILLVAYILRVFWKYIRSFKYNFPVQYITSMNILTYPQAYLRSVVERRASSYKSKGHNIQQDTQNEKESNYSLVLRENP